MHNVCGGGGSIKTGEGSQKNSNKYRDQKLNDRSLNCWLGTKINLHVETVDVDYKTLEMQ